MLPYIELHIKNLTYLNSGYALEDVTINVFLGKSTGIVGESGSGKSTLGKCLSGAMNADEVQFYGIHPNDVQLFIDEQYFEGRNIIEESQKHLSRYRKRVQYIYQNHRAALNMNDTVYGTLLESMRSGNQKLNLINFRQRLLFWLSMLGLISSDGEKLQENGNALEFFKKYPFLRHRIKQLSGGQMKRISILKAIFFQSEVLIADEPLTGLDASKKGIVLQLLDTEREKRKKEGKQLTTVMISHDVGMIRRTCDHIYVMYGNLNRDYGKVVEEINNKSAMADSRPFSIHPYTGELLGASTYFISEKLPQTISPSMLTQEQRDSGCIYDRCPYRDISLNSGCLEEQRLKPSKYYPENMVACYKCTN